jgi:hypothetical protein
VNYFVLLYIIAQCQQIKVICFRANQFFEDEEKLNQKINQNERFFSVELKSKVSLKNITLANNGQENVLVEGTLGELRHAGFAEGLVLEIVGDKGVLRINLSQDDIKQKVELEREV